MTGKEALEYLSEHTRFYEPVNREAFRTIAKDLEILEILKNYLIIGKDKYGPGTWGWVEINLDLIKNPIGPEEEENEEKLKIQRWLNEK